MAISLSKHMFIVSPIDQALLPTFPRFPLYFVPSELVYIQALQLKLDIKLTL